MKYTTDIWLAAYLVRTGHPVASVAKEGKRTRLGFKMSEEEWTTAKLTWATSTEIDIKYTIEKIKDLIFQ